MDHKIVGVDECRCRHCQKIIKKNSVKCPFCGKNLLSYPDDEPKADATSNNQQDAYYSNEQGFSNDRSASAFVSPRSRLITLLLAIFLGSVGAHRFYTGRFISAIVMILVAGTLKWFVAIWVFFDIVTILLGLFRDSRGRFVYNWANSL